MANILDTFTLRIVASTVEDTDSTTPLSGRIIVADAFQEQNVLPGGSYATQFTYRVGRPYSVDDFEIEWRRGSATVLGDANSPSYNFSPAAPARTTEPNKYFPGSVTGRMPLQTGRYTGIIKMNQPAS